MGDEDSGSVFWTARSALMQYLYSTHKTQQIIGHDKETMSLQTI